jgi:hypothetical protein
MKTSTHSKARRIVKGLVLGFAVAAIATPVAQADYQGGLIPRGGDVRVAGHPDGYQPQLRGPETAVIDGWQARFSPAPAIVDGWAQRFETPEPVALVGYRVPDGYQPEVGARAPSAVSAPSAVPVEITRRFDWGDAGIGAGTAFASVLLAAAVALALRGRGRIAHS